MDKCFLCQSECKRDYVQGERQLANYIVACERCGEYVITMDVELGPPDKFVADRLYLLSAVTRHHWDRGERFWISRKILDDRSEFESKVMSQCPRGVQEKVDTVLRFVAKQSDYPGSNLYVKRIMSDCIRLYCKDYHEVLFYVKHLLQQHLLDAVGGSDPPSEIKVAVGGWARLEELERPSMESKQAFVAMWFDKQLDSAYRDGILKLEEDTGFRMLRVDAKQFNDKICDHIVAEIRRSRFMIADVTRHRRAVYFEAGYAKGLGLEVIWTCREDHMKRAERIFDTRQYNHIVWTTPEDLRKKLRDRILATI